MKSTYSLGGKATRNERTRRLTDGKGLTDGPDMSSKEWQVFPNISTASFYLCGACVLDSRSRLFRVPFWTFVHPNLLISLYDIQKHVRRRRGRVVFISFSSDQKVDGKKSAVQPRQLGMLSQARGHDTPLAGVREAVTHASCRVRRGSRSGSKTGPVPGWSTDSFGSERRRDGGSFRRSDVRAGCHWRKR